VLVELTSFCFLPTSEDLSVVNTPFILFGPFYDWHHVNFGPFSELAHDAGATIFEARLSNKLAACTNDNTSVSVHDIQRLLDHSALHSWVVQQHVRDDLHHSKVRIMPIGFRYHGMRATEETFKQINSEWRNMTIGVLRENYGRQRDVLLLTSFNVHAGLFGEGKGPRSELLRNISAIRSLSHAATTRQFTGPREYASALSRSKFVLSPWGWGPDCFRNFEAIALGAVPVVLSEWTVDQTLKDMPHLSVKNWNQLDETMLLREHYRISKQSYSLVQLTQKFWIDKLFSVASNASEQCNFGTRRRSKTLIVERKLKK
jgi:hypothetical protein